ncbi:MAG: 3-keto-disaccharide hydrolase, partial [Verrucomicrobiales bacterium]
IAAGIREDANKLLADGKHKDGMLRLMESLIYEDQPAAHAESVKLANLGAADLAKAPAADREKKKGEIMQVKNALTYLAKHKILPADFAPLKTINQVIDEQGWNKKK